MRASAGRYGWNDFDRRRRSGSYGGTRCGDPRKAIAGGRLRQHSGEVPSGVKAKERVGPASTNAEVATHSDGTNTYVRRRGGGGEGRKSNSGKSSGSDSSIPAPDGNCTADLGRRRQIAAGGG